jgi:hypothetical protein
VSLERDDKIDLTGAETIVLGGRDFAVAKLPLRQIIALADHSPKLDQALRAPGWNGETITPLIEAMLIALKPTYPSLTRDELLDLPVTVAEMLTAIPTIYLQAGARRRDAAAGEAEATSASTSSTGESSSPTSA